LTLVLALLIEVVVFGLMLLHGISKHFIGVFIIIQILLKIIPLYILRNETIDYLPQLFYMGVLVAMYAAWLLLHLFSFKTPTLWAVMSGESVAYCASSMRNGVNNYNPIEYLLYQLHELSNGKAITPAASIVYPYLMKLMGK